MSLPLILVALAAPASASALPSTIRSSIEDGQRMGIETSIQNLGNAGTRRVVESTMRLESGPLTFVVTPGYGSRIGAGMKARGARIGGDVYAKLLPALNSRSYVRAGTHSPVFARFEIGQDLIFGVADRTNLTLGARHARYQGGEKVNFLSAGVRRYVRGGSLSYTLTAAQLAGVGTTLGHTVNASLSGSRGSATQAWFSTASVAQAFELTAGDRRGRVKTAVLRRVQPLSRQIALTGKIGVAKYDTPTNRKTGALGGLGLELRF